MTVASYSLPKQHWFGYLNSRGHRAALFWFIVIVVAHWAEHVVQAVQIWVLDRPLPDSRGVIGQWFPWVVREEALHYAYALVMLIGLIMLRPGFVGRSRLWWNVALGIQVWHHVEHFILLIQAQTGMHLLGRPEPTSILQLVFPRVELHLAYNALVFVPMVYAMYLHRHPPRYESRAMVCGCAVADAP
jgi:hypothetical protein